MQKNENIFLDFEKMRLEKSKFAKKIICVEKHPFHLAPFEKNMTFFSYCNFYRRFRIWTQNWQKFCNLTRGRQFVHFWHFREDSSDYSQTPPEYRRRHFHQKSRKKKIGNNYSHLAIIAIWNVKNCRYFYNIKDIWHFLPKLDFFSRWICHQSTYSK